jgi:hypothetical protein
MLVLNVNILNSLIMNNLFDLKMLLGPIIKLLNEINTNILIMRT